MAVWVPDLPAMQRPLSGPDHFHWLVDRAMRRNGLPGNVSRMWIELSPAAVPTDVVAFLRDSPVVRQVACVRSHVRWPLVPRWSASAGASEVVHLHRAADAAAWLQAQQSAVYAPGALIRFDVVDAPGCCRVLVSFHHTLFDHEGMLNLLRAVEQGSWDGPLVPAEDRADAPGAWREVIASAGMAFRTSGPRLGSLLGAGTPRAPQPRYRTLRFSAGETARIDAHGRRIGAALARSAQFMAAVALLVDEVLVRRGRPPRYLWFSAPVDQRPRHAPPHLLTNVTSFLFFRLDRADLRDAPTAVKALNRQLVAQVRARFPQRYRSLLRAFRRIPAWLAGAMVDLPSLGRWSSFGFSDLGDLSRMPATCAGQPITGVEHLPPVPVPPGLSVVVGREGGGLLVVLGYDAGVLSQSEVDTIASGLRTALVGD